MTTTAVTSKAVTSWRFHEARDSQDHLLCFMLPSNLSEEQVEAAKHLVGQMNEIYSPTASEHSVTHGAYAGISRYHLEQLAYAGGGAGYIEALHITDAPADRCPNVVYHYSGYGDCRFWEFKSKEAAQAAHENCWGAGYEISDRMPKQQGFIRSVFCDTLKPWFYAVGDQMVFGDLVFPDYQQDHPYFVPGEYYVVEEEGDEQVKRCIGSRIKYTRYPANEIDHILVFWDDGTIYPYESDRSWDYPRTLADSQGVGETLGEFRKLIAANPNAAIEILNEFRERSPEFFIQRDPA